MTLQICYQTRDESFGQHLLLLSVYVESQEKRNLGIFTRPLGTTAVQRIRIKLQYSVVCCIQFVVFYARSERGDRIFWNLACTFYS